MVLITWRVVGPRIETHCRAVETNPGNQGAWIHLPVGKGRSEEQPGVGRWGPKSWHPPAYSLASVLLPLGWVPQFPHLYKVEIIR